jgi:nucleotide-binding universal stress UspA family protein
MVNVERESESRETLDKETIMLPIKAILHPTDFSPHSELPFSIACRVARDSGAKLIVLHVLEQPVLPYAGVAMAPPTPRPSEDELASLRDRLGRMQPRDPAVGVEHRLVEGDPAAAILQVARETECELIVMGTHGRSGLSRLLMGSVAEKVVRDATCPVLTVKTPLRAS